MNRSTIKPIVFGVLFGAAAFFAPFLILKVMLFFLVFALICRMFWWGGRGHYRNHYLAYADKIRNMSPEEYAEFKNKAGRSYCCGYDDCCATDKARSESK